MFLPYERLSKLTWMLIKINFHVKSVLNNVKELSTSYLRNLFHNFTPSSNTPFIKSFNA